MPGRTPQLIFLVGAVLLTRLPFLFAGFGLQPDAVRVGLAARVLRETGRYVPSRHGANALHEVLAAAVIDLGPAAVNLLSAIGAVFAALVVYLLVERVRPSHALAAGLAAVLVPFVWIESVEAKDYLPATAAALAAGERMVARRPVMAGLLLGIAGGLRMPMLLFGPAVALAHPDAPRPASFRPIAITALVSFLTAAATLSPAWVNYGAELFVSDPAGQAIWARHLRSTLLGFGALGTLGLIVGASSLPFQRERWPKPAVLRFLLGGIGAQLALLAYDPASTSPSYWVPAVPFVVAFIAAYPPKWPSRVALALLCASGLLLSFSKTATVRQRWVPGPLRAHVRLGSYYLHPFFPPIVQDHLLRRQREEQLDAQVDAIRRLGPGDVVLGGYLLPALFWRLDVPGRPRWKAECCGGVQLRYVLTATEAEGHRVWAMPDALRFNEIITGDTLPDARDL